MASEMSTSANFTENLVEGDHKTHRSDIIQYPFSIRLEAANCSLLWAVVNQIRRTLFNGVGYFAILGCTLSAEFNTVVCVRRSVWLD